MVRSFIFLFFHGQLKTRRSGILLPRLDPMRIAYALQLTENDRNGRKRTGKINQLPNIANPGILTIYDLETENYYGDVMIENNYIIARGRKRSE